jgi:tetratricopeptide (TPR) repeat protein
VESEVARAIADQLRAKLTGREEQVIAAKPTDNPEAYDAYLRGLAFTLKTQNTPANALGAQKYLREAVRLDPKFALSWALLSQVDARGYLTQSLQPTVALREEARQAAETALTLQPNLGEAVLAKGYYHYACLKDYDAAVRYFEQARQFLPNSSRLLSRWLMSREGEASGTGASHTSTKLSGSTRATFPCSASTPFPTKPFVVSPKHCGSVIRCSILHQTTQLRSRKRRPSPKRKAIYRVPRRSLLRFTRRLPTPRSWKYRFTKRSWSAALHRSFLSLKRCLPSLIQHWAT